MDYQRLLDEHDEIDALCRGLVRSVTSEQPDPDMILRNRGDLAAALSGHLAHEDSFIYPEIARRGGASAAIATEFVAEFAELTEDWSVYLDEWSHDCIVGDWTTFRLETMAIVKRLRLRVRRETDALYPAALRSGAITLRPVAKVACATAI